MEPLTSSLLVADELALVREGISRICESSGRFKALYECEDGAAAFELIREHSPDIALLDIHIPRLFCFEVVRKVRDLGISTRFIILAARGDRKLVLEALRCGANAFVLKSGNSSRLAEALDQVNTGGVYVSPELEFDKLVLETAKAPTDPLASLSCREYQVFTLLIDGVRAKEIAARLELSPKTIDTYRASLMRKLDIHDIAGLVKFCDPARYRSRGSCCHCSPQRLSQRLNRPRARKTSTIPDTQDSNRPQSAVGSPPLIRKSRI